MVLKPIKIYGYARVSTIGQDFEPQKESIIKYCEFKNIEPVRLFADKATGKDMNRPEYQKMIEDLKVNPLGVQAIVIHKLDRIGRSLLDLINLTKWLDEQHIGLISITNNIDTTTKEGRLFFYMMGALGEYERELIIERTQAGRERAIAEGKKMGRPIIDVPVDEIKRLMAEGLSKSAIARKFDVHRSTIYDKLKQHDSGSRTE